jgi:NAD(P)-dependent dehydrogenase (short-subunit alcohol dehydrogenase family)
MKLENKVALITGGGRGLGQKIALAMAREGAKVVCCDINNDVLAETGRAIELAGRIVDEDVDRSEMLRRRREHLAHVVARRHVAADARVAGAALARGTPRLEE